MRGQPLCSWNAQIFSSLLSFRIEWQSKALEALPQKYLHFHSQEGPPPQLPALAAATQSHSLLSTSV
jgi:hypothetical protein